MKEKCESLASLPAPLPSLASICLPLPLPLPLPATGVHTLKQGCMSSYWGLCSVCLIFTTTEILSNWWFSWVATEVFRFDGILGFEGGYLKQVCNYCNRVYILHQGLLFSRWLVGYGCSLDYVMLENAAFILWREIVPSNATPSFASFACHQLYPAALK